MNNFGRSLTIGLVLVVAAAGTFYIALGLPGIWADLAGCLAGLTLLAAVSVLFGPGVAVSLIVAAGAGGLLYVAFLVGDNSSVMLRILAFVLGYMAWLVLSTALFGTPIVILPISPYVFFSWQARSAEQRAATFARAISIAGALGLAILVINVHDRPRSIAASKPLTVLEEVEADVRDALAAVLISGLTVRAAMAVDMLIIVTLEGSVADGQTAERAGALARVKRVAYIVNNLRVSNLGAGRGTNR